MAVEDRADAEYAVLTAAGGEDANALGLERLIPERMRRHRARAVQPYVALVRDFAHDIRRHVERARDPPPRGARTDGLDEIADAISRPAGQRGFQARRGNFFRTGGSGERDPP